MSQSTSSAVTRTDQLPAYDDLPVIEKLGLPHCWGVFGQDDDIGTLNLITPAVRRAAFGSALTGETVNLTLPLSEPRPPLYRRPPYRHVIFAGDRNSRDDYLDSFYLQGSTQWDGLRHFRCREFGFYGGVDEEFAPGPGRLGIEHWARRGIVGRGLLLDLARYCAETGRPYDPFSGEAVTAQLLADVAEHQQVRPEPGDVLCVHFGWMEAYFGLPADQREDSPGRTTFAGLRGGADEARFLWDNHVAAIVCDNPAVEVSPGDAGVGSLHRRLIPLLGLALGELFDLRELAVACARRGRWDFLFVSVPLHIAGGVGSPGNALAIV
jgi:Putative cyclase